MSTLFSTQHFVGTNLFRTVVGVVVLYQALVSYAQRALFFGPEGVYSWESFRGALGINHWSVFAFSESALYFEAIYHLGLLIAFVWTLGYCTVWLTPLVWIFVHSFHARLPGLWDGGDNIVEILLVFAMFMDLRPNAGSAPRHWLRTQAHDLAIFAAKIQVCNVYFVAGAAKLAGKYWVNGTAFYYVLRSEEFGGTAITEWMAGIPTLVLLGTWGPLVLQMSFPWLCLFGRAGVRRAVILLAIAFHVGIGVLMGLRSFAALMIAAELLILTDRDYAWLSGRWRQFGATLRHCLKKISLSSPTKTTTKTLGTET